MVLAWLAAILALFLTLVAGDPPSRLFGAVATVGFTLAGLFGTRARPRLAVDDAGLTIRGLTGAAHWSWAQVHRMRVVRHRRLGREIPMLEIDTVAEDGSERLTVLGRIDLDAAPEDVLTAIHTLRGL
ncbi:MAG TPA: PH domain-containing protein [Pseudonocardiaceae bacterium]